MKPLIALTSEAVTLSAKRGAFCQSAYSEAIAGAGGIPVILPLTHKPAILREFLHRCDGLLLTGGADVSHKFYAPRMPVWQRALIRGVDEVRDEMEIFLTQAALRREIPVLGICRGIQVMNVALGGTLAPDVPRHRHPQPDILLHKLRWESASKIRAVIGESAVNSSHHQALDKVAPKLRVTAWAEDGIIESVEHTTAQFFWGVQFHPERLLKVAPQIRRLFTTFCAASSRQAALRSRQSSSVV